MQKLDFSSILDGGGVGSAIPYGAEPARKIYDGGDGVQLRSMDGSGDLVQEVVRISEGAFLFATDHCPVDDQIHHQVVNDTDWVHIQFRLNGGGHENMLGQTLAIPERSCVVARYPKDSIVERRLDKTDRWRVVCLLLRPRDLTKLIDAPASVLPERGSWMAREDEQGYRSVVLSLKPSMVMAARDILSCQSRGICRRIYMRAKALELVSTVLHELNDVQELHRSEVRLSASDLARLSLARDIMVAELENTLTLAELGRRVGLNRTKLAVGFKEIHGMSVQAFWRDAKLSHARDLLSKDGVRVTEVAFSLGYAELSSFTRAFIRKFGVLPRECKGSRH